MTNVNSHFPDNISNDVKSEMSWEKQQKRLEQIAEELRMMSDKAEDVRNSLSNGTGDMLDLTNQMDLLQQRHRVLTIEQNDLMKALRRWAQLVLFTTP